MPVEATLAEDECPLRPRSFRPRSSTGDDPSVLAVGRLVFVACPSDASGRVTVTDEAGVAPGVGHERDAQRRFGQRS